jgi:hypothetical protein
VIDIAQTAQASIVSDKNAAISTPTWTSTIDADAPSDQTHLIASPGAGPPGASDLNPAPGEVEATLVTATVSATGTVNIFNYAGTVNVVVDVVGWYS